LAKALNFKEE